MSVYVPLGVLFVWRHAPVSPTEQAAVWSGSVLAPNLAFHALVGWRLRDAAWYRDLLASGAVSALGLGAMYLGLIMAVCWRCL